MEGKAPQNPTNAMVLAAGYGTRMMPLTINTPKPLIKILDKTLLDYTLDELSMGGISHAVVNVHYHADQIETHLQNRRQPHIAISDERSELLETGGGLKKALPLLGQAPFFSCNTDAIFTGVVGDATRMLLSSWNNTMLALLILVPLNKTLGFDGNGDFHLHKHGRITKASEEGEAPYAFTGLQILHPSLLVDMPDGPFSTRLLWQRAAEQDGIFGCIYPQWWLHVGTPQGVEDAQEFLENPQPPTV